MGLILFIIYLLFCSGLKWRWSGHIISWHGYWEPVASPQLSLPRSQVPENRSGLSRTYNLSTIFMFFSGAYILIIKNFGKEEGFKNAIGEGGGWKREIEIKKKEERLEEKWKLNEDKKRIQSGGRGAKTLLTDPRNISSVRGLSYTFGVWWNNYVNLN